MKVAFVASTLPALFLKKNIIKLNLDYIVCGNSNLKLSYSFLTDINPRLNIIICDNRQKLNDFFKTYLLEKIVIFHECCWPDLDNLLIKRSEIVSYYPCVTLDSFEFVNNPFKTLLESLIISLKNLDLSFLVFIYHWVVNSRNYHLYKMRLDGFKDKYTYVVSLKHKKFNIVRETNCIDCRSKSKTGNSNLKSREVIFVVATDVVSDQIQIDVFTALKMICDKKGLNVVVKNHPNVNFRLPVPENWEMLPPNTPFEVLERRYLIKIGLFSTSLVYEPDKSISIVNLIGDVSPEIQKRINHNISLIGGSIFSPDTYYSFEKHIDKLITENETNVN